MGELETRQASVPGLKWPNAQERKLMRHALGLPNDRKRSYRNRFAAAKASDDWRTWAGLCDAGMAVFSAGIALDHFALTRSAAETVLEPGESLDLEDFPHD